MVTEISVKIKPGVNPQEAQEIAAGLYKINDERCFEGLQPVRVQIVDASLESESAPAAATLRADINVKLGQRSNFVDMDKVVAALKDFYADNFGEEPKRVHARTSDAE